MEKRQVEYRLDAIPEALIEISEGLSILRPSDGKTSGQMQLLSSGMRPTGRIAMSARSDGWYTPRESLLTAFDRHYLELMKTG